MIPEVSVIITTVDRDQMIGRAVQSALSQSIESIEVIVVVDGPNPAVENALAQFDDDRLKVIVRSERGGQGAALNRGIALARSKWTAMLDDDDQWMPTKLAQQLHTAEAADCAYPIVGCRFIARDDPGDAVWPRRFPDPGESIADYLFTRRSTWFGGALVPTSMILAPTKLLRQIPMAEDLERHCDLDWLVRSDERDDVSLVIAPSDEPLAVWNIGRRHDRVSNHPDWRYSAEWIASHRGRVTARAYAGFLLTWASFSARCQGDPAAFTALLREAYRGGAPRATEVLVHIGTWCVPAGLRAAMSRRANPAQHRLDHASGSRSQQAGSS